ncbi:MAG: hypothetical protein R3338_13830 [Thermoanaerobaculia bacterium]|nr:hypothetical protein [Thermoanaerobaculia bacterium]
MKRMTTAIAVMVLLLVPGILGACGGEADTATADVATEASANGELTPEELGRLGARIEAEPERLEELLGERGLTPESYEAAIRDLSESLEESRRYAEAYEKARS